MVKVGLDDNGSLLHLDDFTIEGSCTSVSTEYTVEFSYGTLTTGTQEHIGEDNAAPTIEFEFASFDSNYDGETAPSERAGDLIYRMLTCYGNVLHISYTNDISVTILSGTSS